MVTKMAKQITAKALAKKQASTLCPSKCKASSGWGGGVIYEVQWLITQDWNKVKISQKLRSDLDDKVVDFHNYVIRQRQQHNFPLSLIENMYETPMFFDMPGAKTASAIGEKTVFVCTTGHEKTHFTVVVCCMADGTKLAPMIIQWSLS